MWGHEGFFPFGFFFIILFAFLVIRIVGFRRCGWRNHHRFDSAALLERRLVKGEIDEGEYRRLKDILKEK